MKICLCVGTRPNFIKAAPLIRAFFKYNLSYRLVHTGQHYNYLMSEVFFKELEIPRPDINLGITGSPVKQVANIMKAFQEDCIKHRPDMVVVVGDVNSTLACALTASKLRIPIAHVEAGLRSFDKAMPEEINRVVTDAIADCFFATEQSAVDNLKKEGKLENRIYFVGNVMIDNLFFQLKKLKAFGLTGFEYQPLKQKLDQYVFFTLHRPSNIDNYGSLAGIINALNRISENTPVIFPVHPRTTKMLKQFGLVLSDKIYQLPSLGFQESLYFWKDARLVMTDSGGLQEETTVFGVPCLTLRENTERPITIKLGTNRLIGNNPQNIINAFNATINKKYKKGIALPMWDGKAAERIVEILKREIAQS